MISTSAVVLHTGQSLTPVEYLLRVLGYLLVFTGIGVTCFWGVRVFGVVHSAIQRRGGSSENGL